MAQVTAGAGLICCLVGLLGCSRKPPRLVAPKLDPETLVTKALEAFDTNADGALSQSELNAAPGISSNLAAYDFDGNGSVSRSELEEHFAFLSKLNFALTTVKATVTWNGAPLDGATIEFVPAPHFQGQIKSATGITDEKGVTLMAIPEGELPEAQQGLKGVHTGTYEVRITHPDKSIPAKYNSDTTLGYETRIGDPLALFELKN